MKHKITHIKVADNVTSAPPCNAQFHPVPPPSFALATSSSAPPTASSHVEAAVAPAAPAPETTAVLQPTPDRFRQIKINSLKEKQRADSFFNSLNPEQACKFIDWISRNDDNITDLWRRVKAPAPEGFGMNVSPATIRRLRDAWRAEHLVTAVNSALDVVIDLEEQADLTQAARVQTAMNQMLTETAFELMRTQPASPLLKELLSNIQKLTDLDLKRQKLQLEREKLLSKTASAPARNNTTQLQSVQHHRVDLNIVPPNAAAPRESVVIHSETQPQLHPPIS